MDQSEKIAHDYFSHQGFRQIVFEPEGKKTPDFLLDGRIAVEVRRLNQNCCYNETSLEGIESLAITTARNLKNVLDSFGPAPGDCSWFVDIRFSRPQEESWKVLNRKVCSELKLFLDAPDQKQTWRMVNRNFGLRLEPAPSARPKLFSLGAVFDLDSGGWVTPELERNLKICIDEKTAKVASIRHKYDEWWLVLVDHISLATGENLMVPPHDWDRIILINPFDPCRAFIFP